jgi:glycerol-3-phosphate acyltransferase PlsY
MWQTYLIVALVAYLLGSIPFGYILVKLFLKQDIRTTGSGNIGATNVARSGKKGLAIATLLLDAGKGFAAVLFAHRFYFRTAYSNDALGPSLRNADEIMAFAALMAVLGHIFPIWLRFRGGKGVATGVGAFLAFNSLATGIAFLTFAVLFAITRIVSLSSIIATLAFPLTLVLMMRASYSASTLVCCAAASLVIIVKHHANIRRLLNGTEPKFGLKKAVSADPIQVEKNA